MNKQKAIAELKEQQAHWDQEFAHIRADEILCELLTKIGYEDVVKEYEKIGKWYG